MLDDDIKKQARGIARENELLEIGERVQDIGLNPSEIDNMPEDARAWHNAAWEKELERRDGTLIENERKYEASIGVTSMDKEGNIEESVIVAYTRYIDGEYHVKLTAYGYDHLPPDLQEMYGEREDVVEQYIPESREMGERYNAYVRYAYQDNKGYDSWEAYRDGEGYGRQEEITIEPAQDVADNDKPRETPSVAQDESPQIRK